MSSTECWTLVKKFGAMVVSLPILNWEFMRTTKFECGGYYHIYNRGVDKRQTFMNTRDYERFALSLHLLNSHKVGGKIRATKLHSLDSSSRLVDVIAYCIMPNHFHLLVRQKAHEGVSKFMHRLGNSYTLYFNKKHDRTGHLFEGPFKVRVVENEHYLLHTSRYIHANPSSLAQCKTWERIKTYPHSSLPVYLGTQTDAHLANTSVTEFFNTPLEYELFVKQLLQKPF